MLILIPSHNNNNIIVTSQNWPYPYSSCIQTFPSAPCIQYLLLSDYAESCVAEETGDENYFSFRRRSGQFQGTRSLLRREFRRRLSGVKAAGSWSWLLCFIFGAEVNGWNYTSTPRYIVVMAWCLSTGTLYVLTCMFVMYALLSE